MAAVVTPDEVDQIVAVLTAGGTVVLPTDTVYGIAASPAVAGATDELFARKGRDQTVPLAVLCATPAEAFSLVSDVPAAANTLAAAHWPGPLTLVCHRRVDLGWALGEPATTIGVRCPDVPYLAAVLRRTGPLAVTSANRHGVPTPPTALAAAESLVGPVDLVVDGGRLDGRSSTVVDATSDDLVVLRPGPVVL